MLRFQWLKKGLKRGMETSCGLVSRALEAFHDPEASLTKEVSIVHGGWLISHGGQWDRGWSDRVRCMR